MFGKFSMHAWRLCGGLNKETFYINSLRVTHFGMPRGANMSLALHEPNQVPLHSNASTTLSTNHKEKKGHSTTVVKVGNATKILNIVDVDSWWVGRVQAMRRCNEKQFGVLR